MLDLYTNAITKLMGKIIQKFLKFANFMKQFSIKFRVIIWTYQMNFRTEGVTKDFAIPDDVCETFTKTYQLLKQFVELSQE